MLSKRKTKGDKMPNIYIILDESGDLGFSQGSSEYFVMAAIIAREEDIKKIRRIPKKARQKLGKKKKDIPELKASKSSDNVRRFVINQLFKCPTVYLSAVYIDKKNTYKYVRNDPSKKAYHYNWVTKVLIIDSLKRYLQVIGYSPKSSLNVCLYLDKYHTTRFRKENLSVYLENMITSEIPWADIIVFQKDSQGEPLIQVSDFVANAFYKKLSLNVDFLENFFRSGRILKFKGLY